MQIKLDHYFTTVRIQMLLFEILGIKLEYEAKFKPYF